MSCTDSTALRPGLNTANELPSLTPKQPKGVLNLTLHKAAAPQFGTFSAGPTHSPQPGAGSDAFPSTNYVQAQGTTPC